MNLNQYQTLKYRHNQSFKPKVFRNFILKCIPRIIRTFVTAMIVSTLQHGIIATIKNVIVPKTVRVWVWSLANRIERQRNMYRKEELRKQAASNKKRRCTKCFASVNHQPYDYNNIFDKQYTAMPQRMARNNSSIFNNNFGNRHPYVTFNSFMANRRNVFPYSQSGYLFQPPITKPTTIVYLITTFFRGIIVYCIQHIWLVKSVWKCYVKCKIEVYDIFEYLIQDRIRHLDMNLNEVRSIPNHIFQETQINQDIYDHYRLSNMICERICSLSKLINFK